MVAACAFSDGAVIISDSRATWKLNQGYLSDDSLQKIMYVAPKTSLSFAGSGYLASKVVQHIRQRAKSNKKGYQYIRKISFEIPRIARYYFQKYPDYAKYGLAFILAGVELSGKIRIYHYRSPDFNLEEIANSFVIIGSGEVVLPYLEEHFAKINISQNSLKQKADLTSRGLDSALRSYKAEYVGGLFQVILISSEGIAPLQHYSIEINPTGSSNYMGMRMEKGRWIEEVKGKQIVLMEPHQLARIEPQEKRLYDYSSKTDHQQLQFYLSYFIICLRVERTHGDTVFHGTFAQIGSHKYPHQVPIIASLGFWGPAGGKEVQFRIDYGNKTKTIHTQKIGECYCPERVEIDVPLVIEILSPGAIFLDCIVDGSLLARKALYLADLRNDEPAKSEAELHERYKTFSKSMPEEHRKYSDPMVEKMGFMVDYFFLCQNVTYENTNTIFKIYGEIKSIYWKSYPLAFKLGLATSFRINPGHHLMEIKLKHAMSGEESIIAKCELGNNSSCISIPIYADDLVVQIPKSGMYYVNVSIDGKFAGCALFYAETDKPEFSYSLNQEDLTRVTNGELLILLSRSQQKPESHKSR